MTEGSSVFLDVGPKHRGFPPSFIMWIAHPLLLAALDKLRRELLLYSYSLRKRN